MDLHSTKEALRKHWKWLVGSALVAGSIMLSCGPYGSSTSPICTWINTAIASLPLLTETQTNVPPNNSTKANTSLTTTPCGRPTSLNSSDVYAKKINIKFATSTVANMGTKTNVPIIISASSIIPSTTNYYSRMMKASTPTHRNLLRDFGRTASQLSQLSISKQPLTRLNILSRKS